MKKIKKTKLEKTIEKKERIEYLQKGTGLFLFRNKNKNASLELPKKSKDGKKWVEPNGTWEGDSYFLSMIPKEATLVKSLTENQPKKEETKMEEKLILDQPEQVTKEGKIEHKIKKDLPLNEVDPQNNENTETLLTEDPLAGVTIIRD